MLCGSTDTILEISYITSQARQGFDVLQPGGWVNLWQLSKPLLNAF